jgi:hypothetical protein
MLTTLGTAAANRFTAARSYASRSSSPLLLDAAAPAPLLLLLLPGLGFPLLGLLLLLPPPGLTVLLGAGNAAALLLLPLLLLLKVLVVLLLGPNIRDLTAVIAELPVLLLLLLCVAGSSRSLPYDGVASRVPSCTAPLLAGASCCTPLPLLLLLLLTDVWIVCHGGGSDAASACDRLPGIGSSASSAAAAKTLTILELCRKDSSQCCCCCCCCSCCCCGCCCSPGSALYDASAQPAVVVWSIDAALPTAGTSL